VWRLRESGEFAGRGGLRHTEIEGVLETEVAWAVVPELWGRGLGTEIGRAAVDHAFARLGLPDVVAFTLPDNLPSRRVMEKLGFALEREISHAGLPHVLYRVRPEERA
jgi:RimJ/RimL family protein N-acetyltransferase